jgi:GNAT superfamily N-acetyltransferase
VSTDLEISRIGPAHRRSAIATLGRAFHDDPLFGYFQPDVLRQIRLIPAFMRAVVADSVPHGETWVALADGKAKGVAGWLPPGAYPRPRGREALMYLRFAPAFLRNRWSRGPEGLRLLGAIDRLHPKEPHWYLAVLGVDPELQHRGVGTRLLEPVLDRCDSEGMPAYLETQKPENVAYYRGRGFEVVEEVRLPGSACPPCWTMQREPRS